MRHICVAETRNVGLFGCIQLRQDEAGTPLTAYGGKPHPVVSSLVGEMRAHGVWTLVSGSLLMCNPPLCITEAEMAQACDGIDKALDVVDAVVYASKRRGISA